MKNNTLERLKALCDAAVPGPWETDDFGRFIQAEFIAVSRQALPVLIELVEAYEKKDNACKRLIGSTTTTDERAVYFSEHTKATEAVKGACARLEEICLTK